MEIQAMDLRRGDRVHHDGRTLVMNVSAYAGTYGDKGSAHFLDEATDDDVVVECGPHERFEYLGR